MLRNKGLTKEEKLLIRSVFNRNKILKTDFLLTICSNKLPNTKKTYIQNYINDLIAINSPDYEIKDTELDKRFDEHVEDWIIFRDYVKLMLKKGD